MLGLFVVQIDTYMTLWYLFLHCDINRSIRTISISISVPSPSWENFFLSLLISNETSGSAIHTPLWSNILIFEFITLARIHRDEISTVDIIVNRRFNQRDYISFDKSVQNYLLNTLLYQIVNFDVIKNVFMIPQHHTNP